MCNRHLPLVLLCIAGVLGAEPARDRFGDPLPEGAAARLGSLRLRHGGSVYDVDYSPDGKILAAADGGHFITCWDPDTGREVRRVPDNLHGIGRRVRFSPDGKSLIVISDAAVRVVNAVTGAEQWKLVPTDRDIRALIVSRDGKTAVTHSWPDSLAVWDVVGGKRLREFKIRAEWHRGSHRQIALTPDGKQLVYPRRRRTGVYNKPR